MAKEHPMVEQPVDVVAVHTAESLSRRVSFIALGGAALAAAVARPSPARAGKAGKKAKKKCKRQIGQCESSIASLCTGGPEACVDVLSPCCRSFKGCKAGAAYQCIVDGLLALDSS
jgi:hypothetical protein